MGAALALLTLHAALLTVRPTDARCPSTRQVNEAIAGRLPGVLVPNPAGPAAGVGSASPLGAGSDLPSKIASGLSLDSPFLR